MSAEKGNDEKRSCATCEFSHGIQSLQPGGQIIVGRIQLVCMRRPPSAIIMMQRTPNGEQSGLISQFPPVTAEMFCYDYWPEGEPLPGPDDFDLATGERMTEN